MRELLQTLSVYLNLWRTTLLDFFSNPKKAWKVRNNRAVLIVILYHFIFFFLGLSVNFRIILGDLGQLFLWISLAVFSIYTYLRIFYLKKTKSRLSLFIYIYISFMIGVHTNLIAFMQTQNILVSLILSGLSILILNGLLVTDYLYVNRLWFFKGILEPYDD